MIRAVPRSRRGQRGMTLIEILVVVVIIGILATIATLSVGLLGGDREIERESERLADGIALLQEQAQLEGRDYGLRIEGTGYEFLRFDAFEQVWKAVQDDPGFAPRQLPPGLAFELRLEGRLVLLRRPERQELRQPQLFAWGSGDMTAYELSLVRSGASRVTLIGAADGSIEMAQDEEP